MARSTLSRGSDVQSPRTVSSACGPPPLAPTHPYSAAPATLHTHTPRPTCATPDVDDLLSEGLVDVSPTGRFPDKTFSRQDDSPTGRFPDRTFVSSYRLKCIDPRNGRNLHWPRRINVNHISVTKTLGCCFMFSL